MTVFSIICVLCVSNCGYIYIHKRVKAISVSLNWFYRSGELKMASTPATHTGDIRLKSLLETSSI
jgi:hypothetical protein